MPRETAAPEEVVVATLLPPTLVDTVAPEAEEETTAPEGEEVVVATLLSPILDAGAPEAEEGATRLPLTLEAAALKEAMAPYQEEAPEGAAQLRPSPQETPLLGGS